MICHTMSAQVGAVEKVIAAVKSGELSQDAIQASVARVEALKSKYVSNASIPTSRLVDSQARNSRQALLASKVYAKSTTVVRSVAGSLPIAPDPNKKTVFISPGQYLVLYLWLLKRTESKRSCIKLNSLLEFETFDENGAKMTNREDTNWRWCC